MQPLVLLSCGDKNKFIAIEKILLKIVQKNKIIFVPETHQP